MAYQKTLLDHILDSNKTGGANAAKIVTSPSGDSLAQNVPLIYDANGNVVSTATRTGDTTNFLTANGGDSLTQNVPLLYDADGNVVSTATRTGNTTNYATAIVGSKTSGNYPKWDVNGNLTDGDTGGGGGGAPTNYPTNVPFVDSGFTQVNWAAGTSKSTDGSIFIISRTNILANDFALYVEPVPATPYKLWTRFLHYGKVRDSSEAGGVCWYNDSSGAWILFGMRGTVNLRCMMYGVTQVTPTPTYTLYYEDTLPHYGEHSGAFSFGLEDNGTNKDAVFCPTLQYSRIFRRFTSAEYITPTHIGFWIGTAGAAGAETYIEVLSYDYY